MRFNEMALVTGGVLYGNDGEAITFSTDTRQLQSGDFFVALSGPSFDANAFVNTAAGLGAVGALVSRRDESVLIPQIVVPDTREALGRLALAWRRQYDPVRVAITGSSGKTTTKEMTASIFSLAGPTLATLGNKNNEIGVPLTLLRLRPEHRYGVFELGANHKGEIAYTSGLVQPRAALINNIGVAHLEGFGSRQGIAEAKGEIYGGLEEGGVAIVNADDDFAAFHLDMNRGRRTLTFGVEHPADIQAANLHRLPGGAWGFDLHLDGMVLPVRLQVLGRHNVANALAAASLAHACGIGPELIRQGLEAARAAPGRLELHQRDDLVVIDDTYNANPASMKAALDMLSDCDGVRLAILGGMGELGAGAPEMHAEVGAHARKCGIDQVIAVGNFHEHTLRGFGGGTGFADQEALLAELPALIPAQATILVKGSRSARMERIVHQLINKEQR